MNFYSKLLAKAGLLTNYADFDTASTQVGAVGRMVWNDADGTVNLGLKGGNVTLPIGQKQVARVVNKSGGALSQSDYQVVKVTDAQGQRLAVNLAQANNDANSADTLGIVTETIALNQEGFITTSGVVRDINTTGSLQGETWEDGDILYLSPTTPGAITNIKPIAPQHMVIIGYVEYAHGVNGKIFVKVQNGYELDELHNVLITTPLNNQVLGYEASTQLWKNKSIADWLGYTPADAASISGTTGKLAKFTSSGAVGDSIVSESGSVISVAGALNIGNGITTGNIDFSINGSSGVRFDLTNGILGINRGSGLDIRLYYTGGNTAFRVSNSSGELFINRTPTASAGSFDLLTRNTSTGAVEKVASNYYATAGSISGTTGKLAKFTSSGAVGNSIVTESLNGITTSINQSASTTLVVVENTNNTSGTARASLRSISGTVTSELLSISGSGLFLGTSSNHRVSIMMNGSEYLGINATNGRIQTNQATDTGESFIVGGSARVNGTMSAIGFLRTQDRLYINGDVAISSWISSSLTAGYSSTSSYGWINSQTSLRLGVNGSTQLNLTTSAATFSSSVTTGGHITSGAGVTIAASNNLTWGGLYGANIPTITASHTNGIYYYPIGSSSPTALFRMTTAGALIVNGESDNGVDKLQVNGSISTTSLTGFRLLSGGSPLFTIGYSGGTLFDRLSGTNFFIAENGSPQLTIASGGNVGIGVTSPASRLHINTSTDENVAIGSLSSIPNGRTLILQTTANGGSIETYSSTSGYVNLLLNANGGNVLIGTTTGAGYKLEVNGDTRLRNKTYIGTNGAYIEEYYDGSVYKVKVVDSAGNDIIL